MRISSAQLFQTGLHVLNMQQADFMHLFQKVATGKRMVTPADDPLAASQAVNTRQIQSMNDRFAENRAVLSRQLGTEESVLSSTVTIMQGLKTRLVEVGNGTLSDADRQTLANVLKETRASLLGQANATDGNGQYLFSGANGGQAPFNETTGQFVVSASQVLPRLIQADQTRQINSADTGNDIFMRATPGAQSFLTHADGANTGTGVVGGVSVTNASLADVGNHYEITFTSPTAYSVTMYDAAGTAGTPVLGTIAPGGESVSITLPDGVQLKLNGEPAAGDGFYVASAQKLADPSATTPAGMGEFNLFQALDGLIAVLDKPQEGHPAVQAEFRNLLNSTLQRVDVHYDNILTVRASVGARMNEVSALDTNGDQRGLGYAAQLKRLEDLDYNVAISELQLRSMALEAASLAFKKIQGTTLLSMGN